MNAEHANAVALTKRPATDVPPSQTTLVCMARRWTIENDPSR
jgi:hypothetical protein